MIGIGPPSSHTKIRLGQAAPFAIEPVFSRRQIVKLMPLALVERHSGEVALRGEGRRGRGPKKATEALGSTSNMPSDCALR